METLIFRSDNQDKLEALKAVAKALKIKFQTEESPYNPEFVAKIERGREEMKEGKGTVISMEELESLWK